MGQRNVLRTRTIAVGWALIMAFVGSAGYDGWRLYQQITRANERELSNLVNALGEETSRSLDSVDALLRETATWYESPARRGERQDLPAALAVRAVGLSQVSVLTIVDASGHQLARSRATGEPLADVSDRPYFKRQRDENVAGPLHQRADRDAHGTRARARPVAQG